MEIIGYTRCIYCNDMLVSSLTEGKSVKGPITESPGAPWTRTECPSHILCAKTKHVEDAVGSILLATHMLADAWCDRPGTTKRMDVGIELTLSSHYAATSSRSWHGAGHAVDIELPWNQRVLI